MLEAGNASARSKESCAAADKSVCEIIDHSSIPHGPKLMSGDDLEIGSGLWSRSVPIRAGRQKVIRTFIRLLILGGGNGVLGARQQLRGNRRLQVYFYGYQL